MLSVDGPQSVIAENITIPPRMRPLDEAKVAELVDSISRLGLMSPITVRHLNDGQDLVLIAGRHRLEAVKRLGWGNIKAYYLDGDDDDCRMWEIAENLHRADLSALERAEHIAEWIRLTDAKSETVADLAADPVLAQVEPKLSKRGRSEGRPQSGTNAAVRVLGIERNNAQRSVKIDSIVPEAKQAARETGLDHNQSALLKVASAPKEEQAETVRKIAAEKAAPKPKPPAQAKDQADELADLLIEHLPLTIMPAFLSLYETTEARFVTKTIRRKLKERRAA